MRAIKRLGTVVIFLSCLGCAGRGADVAGDSAHAKYILVAALEAWREGRVKTLETRSPSIRFVDDDQRAGMQLIDYEFENEAEPILPFQNVAIFLELKDPQGRAFEKSVIYQVAVEPGYAVLRSDN